MVLLDFASIAGLGNNPLNEEHAVVVCILGDKRFAVMVNEAMDVVTVSNTEIRITDEVLSGLLREIAVVQTEAGPAAVVDLWSSVVALPLRTLEDPDQLTDGEAALLKGDDGAAP